MSVDDGPLRILCVDDEPGLADLVATYLERDEDLDCDVAVETDPAAALARIREEPFDCVVSDYNMPGRTGIQLLAAVREVEPDLPFLLFTSEHPDDLAAEMVREGVNDYVTKGMDAYTSLIRRVSHATAEGDDGEFGSETEVTLDGVCEVGPDGTFDHVSEAYADLYGYDPEELVGEPWQRLHPDEEVEHIRSHVLPVVTEGGRWTGRSEGLRADGTTFTESKLVTTTGDDRLLIAVSEHNAAARAADD